MSVATEEKPLVRIVEIGCRDFLAVGELNIPVDEITAIDLGSKGGSVRVATREGGHTIVKAEECEALRRFIYEKV